MMKRKFAGITALMLAAAIAVSGCGKKEAETQAPQTETQIKIES